MEREDFTLSDYIAERGRIVRTEISRENPNQGNYSSDNPTDDRKGGEGPTHSYTLQGYEQATSSNTSYPGLDSSCRGAYIFGV